MPAILDISNLDFGYGQQPVLKHVTLQVEAIKAIKIDKVTVWDSGAGANGSTTTANFLAGMVKSLPPLHDVAAMAGLDLPKYLGDANATPPAVPAPNGHGK